MLPVAKKSSKGPEISLAFMQRGNNVALDRQSRGRAKCIDDFLKLNIIAIGWQLIKNIKGSRSRSELEKILKEDCGRGKDQFAKRAQESLSIKCCGMNKCKCSFKKAE